MITKELLASIYEELIKDTKIDRKELEAMRVALRRVWARLEKDRQCGVK